MQVQDKTDRADAIFVGIDVSKDRLDVCLHPTAERFAVTNDAPGRRALLRRLRPHAIVLVAMEPTAKYHRAAHRHLHEAGLPVALVNPLRARRFAEALRQLAKTDRLDAAVLALFAERMRPAPTTPPSPYQQLLAELVGARTAAIAERVALANRRKAATSPFLRRTLATRLCGINRHLAALDKEIAATIATDPVIARRAALLRSIPGIGPVAATALIAQLGEIGRLSAKQAAALVGLAPIARDSGQAYGQRHIRGGRSSLRNTMYMAALVASRHNPDLSRFYQRLRDHGKAPKLALVAVARKLVVLANRIVAQNRPWLVETA